MERLTRLTVCRAAVTREGKDLVVLPLFIPPLNLATNTCCFFFDPPLVPPSSRVPLALHVPVLLIPASILGFRVSPVDSKRAKEILGLFVPTSTGEGNAYGSCPTRRNELSTIYTCNFYIMHFILAFTLCWWNTLEPNSSP
jgi:hypothetical protein